MRSATNLMTLSGHVRSVSEDSDSLPRNAHHCNMPVISLQCESASAQHNHLAADTDTSIGADLQVER